MKNTSKIIIAVEIVFSAALCVFIQYLGEHLGFPGWVSVGTAFCWAVLLGWLIAQDVKYLNRNNYD